MTSLTAGHTLSADHEEARRATPWVAGVTLALATGLTILGANSTSEIYIILGVVAVAAALVFGFVVPRGLRHETAGGRALAMAVVGALLVVPAFWSGLPVVLGSGATLLGYAGKRAEHWPASSRRSGRPPPTGRRVGAEGVKAILLAGLILAMLVCTRS